ncbi:MAG: Cof-type HAD-IIB family hydrolase [Actinomycetota bacterium]|nr:Cof-type HAD-IIB family hydrolase [Actinomycetota bacterium]
MGRARVVASDLDGTLLRTDGSLSDRTRAAWASAEQAGLSTVLVTARPPRWLDELESIVGAHGVALCGNGAFVYDVPSRTVIAQHGFDLPDVALLVGDLRRELPGIVFGAERRTGLSLDDGYHSDYPVPAGALRGPVEELSGDPVGKLLARHPHLGDEAFRARVAEVVGERGVVAYSGAGGLAEISAPGVTKAAALGRWCADLGVPASAVWAFGDMPNDLPMLVWAGTGVAVANGHADVVGAADLVTGANDDDGVARVVEHLVLGS